MDKHEIRKISEGKGKHVTLLN